MLIEAQVAELLRRCETLLGQELTQLRGNLKAKQVGSRSAAIFELIVLEAASEIGPIESEPNEGTRPDIRLELPAGRKVYIEVTYLLPRYWKEERQTLYVRKWIFSAAEKYGIDKFKIFTRFEGKASEAGYVRILPALNEEKSFLESPEIRSFFENISKLPDYPQRVDSEKFTLSIQYIPTAKESATFSSGLAQEAPKSFKEHALYRKLREKAQQHKNISDPRIICVGSDQSPALRDYQAPGVVKLHEVINRFLAENSSISAVIIVSIENAPCFFRGIKKAIVAKLFINRNSKAPLTPAEIELLQKMNFGKWKYSDPLDNCLEKDCDRSSELTSTLTWRYSLDMA
jgi:hypothetical protein